MKLDDEFVVRQFLEDRDFVGRQETTRWVRQFLPDDVSFPEKQHAVVFCLSGFSGYIYIYIYYCMVVLYMSLCHYVRLRRACAVSHANFVGKSRPRLARGAEEQP
jgi:hypothetical protein